MSGSHLLQTAPEFCCLRAMNSAKSSSQPLFFSQKASKRWRSPEAALLKKRRAADSSSAVFQGVTRSKSTASFGKSGTPEVAEASSQPCSSSRRGLISRGFPASAEKLWYGESP